MQAIATTRTFEESTCLVTHHARERMNQRCITDEAIRTAIDCGRELHLRGALIYAVGRREIEFFQRQGLDLSAFDGIQVVCDKTGRIITTYRNRDFRGLRMRRRLRRSSKRIH